MCVFNVVVFQFVPRNGCLIDQVCKPTPAGHRTTATYSPAPAVSGRWLLLAYSCWFEQRHAGQLGVSVGGGRAAAPVERRVQAFVVSFEDRVKLLL